MSESPTAVRPLSTIGPDEDFELPDICARPQCRREFRQTVGRGRKANYCSETCRRLADRDYKRAKATVEHFERLARRSRYDVLAFGRSADEASEGRVSPEAALSGAASAMARADAVLRFVNDADQRLVDELAALRDGVQPLVDLARVG